MAGGFERAKQINESIIAWTSRRVLIKKLAELEKQLPLLELAEMGLTALATYLISLAGFMVPYAAIPFIVWYYAHEGASRAAGHSSAPAVAHA